MAQVVPNLCLLGRLNWEVPIGKDTAAILSALRKAVLDFELIIILAHDTMNLVQNAMQNLNPKFNYLKTIMIQTHYFSLKRVFDFSPL